MMPMPCELEQYSNTITAPFLALNEYLDYILETVYNYAQESHTGGRTLIFSSSNPQVCTALNWKQPNYGVFFKTFAGYSKFKEFDKRCNSIKEAIKFCKVSNLLGIFCLAKPLVQVFDLIKTIKESGLILASFGDENEIAKNVDRQENSGLDAVIHGNLFRYLK